MAGPSLPSSDEAGVNASWGRHLCSHGWTSDVWHVLLLELIKALSYKLSGVKCPLRGPHRTWFRSQHLWKKAREDVTFLGSQFLRR